MIQEQLNAAFDLMDKGRLDEALEVLEGLTVSDSDDAYYSYLSTYGYVYTAKKEFRKALASYQTYLDKAIKEADDREQQVAHHQLCMVYRQQGDYGAAMAELEKERAIIERAFPEDDLVWSVHLYEFGYVSYLMGQQDPAEEAMRKSLEFSLKTDDVIAQACAYRGLGEILSDARHLNQARHLFDLAGDEIGCQEIDDLLAQLFT